MTAIQGLGIETYYYIRCPSCGKVLATLAEEYTRLVTLARQDIIAKIPMGLAPEVKQRLYNELFDTYFTLIMNKLGVKRLCCMMRLKNPQQISVPNPINPIGNIAVNRQTIVEASGRQRAVTLIQLTKRSLVPGKSNINMMSIHSEDGTITNQLEPWELKMRKELDPESIMEDYTMAESEPLMIPSVEDVIPIIQTGTTRAIKKPKVKNVTYVGTEGKEGTTNVFMKSNIRPQYSHIPTIEDSLQSDETLFMDIEKLNLFG